VLDDIQRLAHVNTIFLGVFTYTDTRAGVRTPNFHGGNFAAVHPQYSQGHALTRRICGPRFRRLRNVLADMIPEARKRGMKTFCWVIEDNFRPKFGKTDEIWGATSTAAFPSAIRAGRASTIRATAAS